MTMKYYKDPWGAIYAFEADGSQDAYIRPDLTLVTEEEADLLRRPSTARLIEAAHARISVAYEDAVNALTWEYPDAEISSWPRQEAEARAFLADENAVSPWLRSAAAARGINVPNLAALVMRKAEALASLHGTLTGKRQRLRDAIDALGGAPTQEQLDAIQWDSDG